MSTVHIGSTLSNPYKLNEEELREALVRANDDLLRKDIEIAEIREYANSINRFLYSLCEAHIACRSQEVIDHIESLVVIHKQRKAEMSAMKVH